MTATHSYFRELALIRLDSSRVPCNLLPIAREMVLLLAICKFMIVVRKNTLKAVKTRIEGYSKWFTCLRLVLCCILLGETILGLLTIFKIYDWTQQYAINQYFIWSKKRDLLKFNSNLNLQNEFHSIITIIYWIPAELKCPFSKLVWNLANKNLYV